jgi:hypothetical protein
LEKNRKIRIAVLSFMGPTDPPAFGEELEDYGRSTAATREFAVLDALEPEKLTRTYDRQDARIKEDRDRRDALMAHGRSSVKSIGHSRWAISSMLVKCARRHMPVPHRDRKQREM